MQKNKKVVIISTEPSFIISNFVGYLDTLIDNGYEVYLLTKKNDYLSSKYNVREVNISRNISLLNDFKAFFIIVFYLIVINPNFVHSATPKGGLLGMVASFFCRIPNRIHTFTGQVWVNKSGVFKSILMFCDKIIVFCSTQLYTDSFTQKDFLIESKISSSRKIDVINDGSFSGVDLGKFNKDKYCQQSLLDLRIELGINDRAQVVLFLGRIVKDKGISELINVAKKIGNDVIFLFVGPVEDCTFSAQFNCVPNIIHVKYTLEPEKYIALCDFLCLPSYREGFGTVVIEAAAMKKTTVASNIYGLRDAVDDGNTGLLVEKQNEIDLFDKVNALLLNTELLKLLEENAYKRVIEKFDARILNRTFLDNYNAMSKFN